MSRDVLDVPPEEAKRRAIADLANEFGQTHDLTHISDVVDEAFGRLDTGARYKEFVPLLTARIARETLRREAGG